MNISPTDLIFYTLVGTILFVLMVGFFFTFVIMYQRRQLEYKNERIRMERVFSEELLRTQLELSEQVMRNISEEIHDNIGQTLTVAKLGLNAMVDSENNEQVENVKRLITRSLKDLRSLSKTLSGDFIIREGIQNAIAREVEILNSTGKLICEFSGDIPSGWLHANSEIILFRCVQEALSNALKHANAERITLDVSLVGNMLRLNVDDDGVGFDQNTEINKGLGMSSMEKRVGILGGKFKITSSPDKGTCVSIQIPKMDQKVMI